MTCEEWEEHRPDRDSAASYDEVTEYIEKLEKPSLPQSFDEAESWWSEEEELVSAVDVVSLGEPRGRWKEALLCSLRLVAMFTAVVATLVIFWDPLRSFARQACPQEIKGDSSGGSLSRWLGAASGDPVARSIVI